MPVYKFTGRSYDGSGTVTGERSALNKPALAAALRGENILPIEIQEQSRNLSFKLGGKEKIKSKDLSLFAKQFSVMLDAGLPLVQCLDIIAEQQEKQIFKDTLKGVREDVEAGATLADAMRKHPKAFDHLFVNMIAAGEAGGVLDIILQRLTIFLEKTVKLKRALISASVYPTAVISFAVIIVFVIMVWVIPVFATLFEGLGAPLPLPTRIVMQISSWTRYFAIPLIGLLVLTVWWVKSFYATENGELRIDTLLLKLPIFGQVLTKIIIARFSRTLATLIASGIPILGALEITANTAGNALIRNTLLKVRKEVAGGKTIVEPMRSANVFPSMVTQIIGVGEQTGELDQMLSKLADYYEEESDGAIANFLTLIEPVMIGFLGLVIGSIVISMYLPIFSLIEHLAKH